MTNPVISVKRRGTLLPYRVVCHERKRRICCRGASTVGRESGPVLCKVGLLSLVGLIGKLQKQPMTAGTLEEIVILTLRYAWIVAIVSTFVFGTALLSSTVSGARARIPPPIRPTECSRSGRSPVLPRRIGDCLQPGFQRDGLWRSVLGERQPGPSDQQTSGTRAVRPIQPPFERAACLGTGSP